MDDYCVEHIDAASRESKVSISWHSFWWLLDVEDAIVAREHICKPLQCASYCRYVLGTDYMMLEGACTVLFAWDVAALEMHSCGCASPKRSKTTCHTTPGL